jgi:hypothetical protein
MYDGITPAQWVVGLAISLGTFGGLAWLLWRVSTPRAERAQDMSTPTPAPQSDPAGLERSKDQSAQTSPAPQTTPAPAADLSVPAAGLNSATPDMDAEKWPMPRLSSYLTDREFLVMLARQKSRAGQWRLSANAIVKVVGGDRTEVLRVIRELREGPTEITLTPEQQAARQALGLDQTESGAA